MDFISCRDEARSVWIFLLGPIIYAYADIRDVLPLVGWEILLVDKEEGVGTLYLTVDSLCKTTKFVAVGALQHFPIFRVADEMPILHQFAGGFV